MAKEGSDEEEETAKLFEAMSYAKLFNKIEKNHPID
jgi:hypothetical protein